ncbi:hypothetical protein DYB26_010683, partial [Aphanomyces astaci]
MNAIEEKIEAAVVGFDPSPRSLYTVANLEGEATWITFVLHDLFVPFISTNEMSQMLAACCTLITWVGLTALELLSPRLPSRTCTIGATRCRRLCHGGMITLGKFVFDLKLWMIYHPLRHERGSYTFASTIFQQPTKVDDAPLANESTIRRRRLRLRACIGLGYVITTITGSYSYLELSKNDFSNDYLWTSFDATGTLTCWYNNNLQMTTALSLQLTSTPFRDLSLPYNSSEPPMLMVPLYVSSIHTNTLTNVVQSVRRMDGCALPWNHSPYCYVDFNRRNVNSVAGEVQSWQARNVTHYMLVPQDLVDVVKLAIEVLGGVGAQQEYLGAPVVSGFDSMPSAWDAYGVVADNILCGVGK